MQDDDDKPIAPAPEGAPADDKSEPDKKPEDEKPEGEPTETDAKASDEDADETDDEDEDEGDDEGEEEGEGDEDVPKRKASRAQRYKRRALRAEAEAEALRSRSGGSLPPADQLNEHIARRVIQEIGLPPKQDDFKEANGNPDYIRFHNAQLAWELDARQTERAVRKDLDNSLSQHTARTNDLIAAHKERETSFKRRVKDYDEVMAKATLPVAQHVERLILESKRSERIAYHLAKNQAKLARLNKMSSEDVARELGRIEGRLSLPPPAKQTQARKPITPLRGGGTGPQSQTAARDAWLKKTYGDRV